jgi:signal transduction histidine kinase
LTIILNNFISNGIRYFDPAKSLPFIEIRMVVDEKEAQITIEDNGIGIKEEEVENIFKMFYRASESSKGSGLGLFIVKESVDRLGGKITVASKLGKGTKFIVTLPNHYVIAEANGKLISANA